MNASLLVAVVLMGLAGWRVTRFLLLDSMFEGTRFTVEHHFGTRPGFLNRKLNELISCPWCVSVWVCAGLTALWRWQEGDGLGWFATGLVWLATCGAAMAAWKQWEDE